MTSIAFTDEQRAAIDDRSGSRPSNSVSTMISSSSADSACPTTRMNPTIVEK